ncbi:MAG: cupin domain-containing protein [Kofleriaceae bacterium]|nr:cupin domain-containing protein [Kofleriaceae bacterium]
MSADPRAPEALAARAAGALDDEERAAVDAAIAATPALAAEAAALDDAAAALAASALLRAAAAATCRARAGARVPRRRAGQRARRLRRALRRHLRRLRERARALLARVDDPDAWEAGPAPGTWLIHFEAGPACAGADTGFVRCAPGTTFPWHRHLGAEHNLVLAGHADDSRFGRLGPGDEATADGDTEHDFTVVGDRPFLYAVRVFGVDFTVPRPA